MALAAVAPCLPWGNGSDGNHPLRAATTASRLARRRFPSPAGAGNWNPKGNYDPGEGGAVVAAPQRSGFPLIIKLSSSDNAVAPPFQDEPSWSGRPLENDSALPCHIRVLHRTPDLTLVLRRDGNDLTLALPRPPNGTLHHLSASERAGSTQRFPEV